MQQEYTRRRMEEPVSSRTDRRDLNLERTKPQTSRVESGQENFPEIDLCEKSATWDSIRSELFKEKDANLFSEGKILSHPLFGGEYVLRFRQAQPGQRRGNIGTFR